MGNESKIETMRGLKFHSAPITCSSLFEQPSMAPDWVQLMRVGTFYDARYGKIEVTKRTFDFFVLNFQANVRGVDLAIDYSHESGAKAAGWIRDLEIKNDSELWAQVSWTPEGWKKIAEKEFRYLSADFTFDYEDNETLKTYGPVLYGAGLTNRPVIKGMQSTVALHEPTKEELQAMNEIEKLQAELATLTTKFSEFVEAQASADKQPKKLADGEDKGEDMEKKFEELMKENKSLKEQLAQLMKDKKASEKVAEFNTLLLSGKVCEAQREAFIEGDLKKFAELAENVNLSVEGANGEDAPDVAGDVQEQVIAKAEKLAKETKVSFSDAVTKILSENKELAKAYYGLAN